MKRIVMLALLSTLAVGAFAGNGKAKKHSKCENGTEKKCTPACKDKSGNTKTSCCNKA
ncbi:MAG: hypothetical protein ACM3H8_00120 [Sphingobacteriales bacterium]